MANGYTWPVKDGSITTFRDYALTCARAFGAFIEMRDDPLDKKPERPDPPDPNARSYKKEALAEHTAERNAWLTMSENDKRAMFEQKKREAEERWWKTREEEQVEHDRYQAMLTKVDAFKPPTPDHANYADFLREQIRESMKHDCRYLEYDKPEDDPHFGGFESFETWALEHRKFLDRMVSMYEEDVEEEKKRIQDRYEWAIALFDAIDATAAEVDAEVPV